ncbi:zinc finger CCHC domain-containing protein 7-like [Ylistrum balloti]|uniref:zinc finger CCHC domain-containing protein 7-like n=1 Tax=Ylistrum balloti TaxID=509963 RepID=UPI002905E984|nr:zinc finger CCHC domain-containing protein 7-like [Ylistrum balloti]
MFYESDQHSYYDSNEYNDDENSESDREEIESALYAQIHFHHEEEDRNCSFRGYATSIQTRCPELTPVNDDLQDTLPESTITKSGSSSTPICIQSSPSTSADNIVLSEEESLRNSSDWSDSDSDCMILDDPVSNTGDIKVHVKENQQPILQAMSDNVAWKISEMDETSYNHKSNPTPNRYYNPITVRCHNCKEMGHISNVCPKPKKAEICHLCGMTGHFFRKCPEGICYNCESPGHISRDCPQPCKQRGQICFRCLMPGHSKNVCPDIWRQFHVTTSGGPVQKINMKPNPKRFCSNCASRKHFGFECVENRMERHEHGNYPFISTYTHIDERFPKGKPSRIHLKKPNKERISVNQEKSNWEVMKANGTYKGKKRKRTEESGQKKETVQRKHRKRERKRNRVEDAQQEPKTQKKKKNKQNRRNQDAKTSIVEGETENHTQTSQVKQKNILNRFSKGKKNYVSKDSWQACNPQYEKDRTCYSDQGFKASYNRKNNFNRGFKTSFNQNIIPHQ